MDIINQIVEQEQSIFIMLAEFAVFTVLLSLIIYHLIIYVGRKSLPEGRLYLYFSALFFGLLFYIFLDTCQYEILLGKIIDVPRWTTFLISLSWMIILKSIMLILQYSLNPNEKKVSLLKKVFIGFVAISAIWLIPIIFQTERYSYCFYAFWVSLGTVIAFLSGVYFPVLRKRAGLDASSKIIGWAALLYINYIWFYKLTITNLLVHSQLPFWMVNNFLKIAIAFTFAYALACRFNKEFADLAELKENLEKKVEENTRELRLAKEKIEEASALKTSYFINVAHETKTPLTLIGNYLDRYSKRVGPSAELSVVKENFDLLRESMVLFLDVEKFEKGEVIYDNLQVCDLSRAIALKMLIFEEEATQRNRRFCYESDTNICMNADPLAIERIIYNLFDNAMKFTRKLDKIHVSLTKNNEMAQLTVSDTGIGIDLSELGHIFDLYYQTSAPNNNGFGMGLFVVKQTVDSLHGTIDVTSAPGKGTTFTVRLPLIPEALLPKNSKIQPSLVSEKQAIAEIAGNYPPNSKNLLVVEDNIDMLRYIHDELADQYNVFIARNGNEALTLLKTSPKPDLILSDVMMDGMDGFDFYRHISEENIYASIPFIFITARSNNTEKIAMLKQGASDYIFKPFSMEELKAKIVSVLKNTSLHRNAGLQDAIDAIHLQINSPQMTKRNKWDLFAIRSREYNLTDRQIEVIKLVEQGLEYKQMAEVLHISPKTIHRHIQILFEKFQVHNKLELLKILFE